MMRCFMAANESYQKNDAIILSGNYELGIFQLLVSFCTSVQGIHPQSLTWNLKVMVSKRNLLFPRAEFHVRL